MARPHKSPSKLPQRQETWYLAVRELRIWITPPDEEPYRPYGALVVNLDQGLVQDLSTFPSPPAPEQVIEKLFEAMRSQPPGTGQKPHRPKQVHFEDQNLMRSLASVLEEIGVSAAFQPAKEIADEIFSELEERLSGGLVKTLGLLSQKGVTPKQIEALFEAAAQYYRAAPWAHLTNMQPLAIQVKPETKARYVVVMGNAGLEYGIALYKQWNDFLMGFGPADRPEDVIPTGGAHSLFFGDATQVPFDDLDAIAEHGWEVVDEEGYPIPVVFTRDGEVKRPGSADLRWYEAAMLAIIKFVPEHLKPDDQGDYHPVKVELTVPTRLGEKKVTIEYPAGDIPIEDQPVAGFNWAESEDDDHDFDFPVGFDRRAMESSLAAFGGGFEDPRERQAQEVMYGAWNEQNPAKRINLAHRALAISPNCADAYVLLAEEEAGSIGRALEYYQKGVKAGEKALGEAFFAENEGYFWGILETRPYMRARAGLANLLWDLGRKEEAQAHYREMLRLNPNDNQGIRYALLGLLLELNRLDEVDALLGEYEDDWSAEWSYTKVLRAFQKEGDSQAAQEALKEALEQNPYVPGYLTGAKRLSKRATDYITMGGESEAGSYASASLNIWRKTPGAVPWLKEKTQPPEKKCPEKLKKKTKRGPRGKKK
jgi:tetratricopeptide (TPR) repeat protein